MKIVGNDVILSTGTTFYAYAGVLGISDDGGEIETTYGFDGGIIGEDFTLEERAEIAEYVISLWKRWAT